MKIKLSDYVVDESDIPNDNLGSDLNVSDEIEGISEYPLNNYESLTDELELSPGYYESSSYDPNDFDNDSF